MKRLFGGPAEIQSSCTFRWLSAPGIAEEVAKDVARSAYPGHAPELAEALAARSAVQATAAAALAVDPTASHADRLLLARLASLGERQGDARKRLAEATIEVEVAERELAAAPRPLGPDARAFLYLLSAIITLVFCAAVGGLLAPSVDAFLLRSYLVNTLADGAEEFSALVALYLSAACAFLLLGGQLVAAILANGRLGYGYKAAFLLADAAFAGGFALMRLADTFTWQATAVSLFEFALTLAGTFVVLAVAKSLARHDEHRAPHDALRARAKAATLRREDAERDLARAEEVLAGETKALGTREDDVRRQRAFRELAAATARAAYVSETSHLIAASTTPRAAGALSERLDVHLGAAFKREQQRKAG